MQDAKNGFSSPLAELSTEEWLAQLEEVVGDEGYLQPLGPKHSALYIDGGQVLLVSFETIQDIQRASDDAQPMGWDMVSTLGWSNLSLISDGDTWFRDEDVYGYFDALIDDGFFDEFDTVIFYGAGSCGYAAAAFSVAAPGAKVIAVQPQATLDPRVTEWDERFLHMRRIDFTDRFGYAPDMLDAADRAYVLYDPYQRLDAMHAALFTRDNVQKLRMPLMGDELHTDLSKMEILYRLIAKAANGTLNDLTFADLYRARRNYVTYLRRLLSKVDNDNRTKLAELICANVVERLNAPRFKKRLAALREAS